MQKKLNFNPKLKQFKCTSCNERKSLNVGTFFEDKKLKLHEILFIGYLWISKANWTTTRMQTGFSEKTVTNYFEGLRNQI